MRGWQPSANESRPEKERADALSLNTYAKVA